MILQLNYDTTRIALSVKHWPTGRHVGDWRNLHLAITPGQDDSQNCCHTGGSPWYLWGCWPGKLTGVDIANPPAPDFAPFIIPAHERDSSGRIVFILPERWRQVAYGRYTGAVWYMQPYVLPPVLPRLPKKYPTPDLYPSAECSTPPAEPCKPAPMQEPACILAKFDIDYGYKCSEHIIDEAAVALSLSTCEEDV